jgi:hypothetical protein
MKQNLNEEINRIKKLLNIKESNIILEANPILGIVRRLGSAIESRFITGIEAKMGKTLANASDAEITTALKSAEMAVIRKEIAEAIYIADKNIIDSVLSKYNMTIPGDAAAAYTELSAQGYNRAILKDINKAYKAGRTSGGAGAGSGNNSLTQPAPAPRPSGNLNLNPDATIRQSMDASIAQTARRDPKALAYYGTIETFGLSENVERAMKYQYSTIGNMTPSELLMEANKLSKQLDQKKYGWLIRLGGKVAEDPAKTVTVAGKTFALSVLYIGLGSLALAGLTLTFAFRDKIMNLFGQGSGNQQNTNTGNMGDVDWNKYKPANSNK